MRKYLMKKRLLIRRLFFLCAFMFGFFPHAEAWTGEANYQAETGVRSYPFGSLISAQAGYDIELWRVPTPASPAASETFWQYGYLRSAVLIDTAFVVNRLAAEVEIYPIAPLGIAIGTGYGLRSKNEYVDFDCATLSCNQALGYNYLRAKLGFAYGSAVFLLSGRYDTFRSASADKPFYDEMSYLVGQAEKDDLKSFNVLSGYKMDDEWMVGILGTFQSFLRSRANNSSVLALLNYSWKNDRGAWRASLGAGPFRSSLQRDDFSVVLSVHWTGAQGLGLF